MKFKIGDKVKHKDFGVGKIIGFDENDTGYAVEFEHEHYMLHNFPGNYMNAGLSNPIDRKAGYWCWDDEIELVEEAPKNLIPQIAKMLGVEIGEKFKISKNSDVFEFTKDKLIGIDSVEVYNALSIFFELITGKKKIIKLPPKPLLTEDEKVILRNLPKEYNWIARDKHEDNLCVFLDKPRKREGMGLKQWVGLNPSRFDLFNHLFQFVKWKDSEPYNIEELLKGE